MDDEKKVTQLLVNDFLKVKDKLEYVNLNENNEYSGWVSNFNLNLPDGEEMSLDLRKENDLFLLFVLAIAWSRSGYWENAAAFVTYLKIENKNTPEYWLNEENIELEIDNRSNNAQKIQEMLLIDSRVKISFREDIFRSMNILATKWNEIKRQLEKSSLNGDYISFMKYLRSIKGLGVNSNRIYIKIPLILRELRCQNIYDNIPGELCCVPDARVEDTCKELGIKLPAMIKTGKKDTETLIKVSSKIYGLFGDLYDIPLFAYEDIVKEMNKAI